MRRAKQDTEESRPIYTLDTETDPFKYGRVPVPFSAGAYDGATFHYTWGPSCIKQMLAYIESLPPGIVYVHNGGRFDFYYFIQAMQGEMVIINSRIVKAYVGKHEFRDSFAIMPFALKQYKKDDIDYNKLEAGVREQHKEEILSYLKSDCVYLWELCSAFVSMFGEMLTIGSTSMKQLQKLHKFEKLNHFYDEKIRSRFYFGGRVECFKKGLIYQTCKIYDVNSMYPAVMRDYLHPVCSPTSASKQIQKDTCFIIVQGKNYGAFPVRTKNGGIDFNTGFGTFGVSIHEWNVALEYDLFRPTKIINCVNFEKRQTFAEFVNHFYESKKEATRIGDTTHALFYKYVLNSAYGKFAQNPTNYFDYTIGGSGHNPGDEWKPSFINGENIIWKKASAMSGFSRHNVATASSITGAARSVLLRAIATSHNVLYCDTDSIVCEFIGKGAEIDDLKLGAWKLEKTGDRAAIAGKKLYAIFKDAKCIKMASKGVKLKAEEIERVANGETIKYVNEAPSFKWDGSVRFITRTVRLT